MIRDGKYVGRKYVGRAYALSDSVALCKLGVPLPEALDRSPHVHSWRRMELELPGYGVVDPEVLLLDVGIFGEFAAFVVEAGGGAVDDVFMGWGSFVFLLAPGEGVSCEDSVWGNGNSRCRGCVRRRSARGIEGI